MADVITLPTRAEIQRVVQQIVARFRPHKVILFGSYAGGTPTAQPSQTCPTQCGTIDRLRE